MTSQQTLLKSAIVGAILALLVLIFVGQGHGSDKVALKIDRIDTKAGAAVLTPFFPVGLVVAIDSAETVASKNEVLSCTAKYKKLGSIMDKKSGHEIGTSMGLELDCGVYKFTVNSIEFGER
jgi:hypothetical protein